MAGPKPFSARRTFDSLKVSAANFCRGNHLSAFPRDRIEGRLHFFEIDFPQTWHR